MSKKKNKNKKKKIYIEIRTNKKWKLVQLLADRGSYLLVKLPTGEVIRRKSASKIHWGKTRNWTGKMFNE